MNHKIIYNNHPDIYSHAFSIRVYQDKFAFTTFHAFKYTKNNEFYYGFLKTKKEIIEHIQYINYLIKNDICKIEKYIPMDLYEFKFHKQFLLQTI